ncbi:FAD-binding 8 [Penicillium maclennaniae]|uniref:FAD-binding 8 n=1 Tax=Penicillium maclennaniae TaxID=1343394 RepID=UPI0025424D24|nr:FAD-binding 8 [Penicillium maclennaniae]KAJ5676893.1 FAD-binding 8 [Penicillium maclennaniae]
MAAPSPQLAARSYGINATYIYEYSRGLGGVDVPRDVIITRIIYFSVIILAFVLFCSRIALISHSYLREITALSASKREQNFWSLEQSSWWPFAKKQIIYAPLGKKRHNREVQLSSAIGMGTLPSRFQTILISFYLASQVVYCLYLDYGVNEKAALVAELRGRSGTLAVLNMVPLFLLATRNNPLIAILHISFDTYNLIHRWLGRIVVLEAITHTAAWAVNACDEQNLTATLVRIRDTPFFAWGMVGTGAMIFLVLHSPSPIRHAFYETFLHLHQLAALLAFIGVYAHLSLDSLPQRSWAHAIAVIWLTERCIRLLRLAHLNLSSRNGSTKMTVQALPGEACRVTFHLPKRVNISPGCHVFAYIPCVSWWMSHPFSIAWFEPGTNAKAVTPSALEKQSFETDTYFDPPTQTTKVSLIISARQGMTRRLYDLARSKPDQILRAPGYIEGPYGSHPVSMPSYGTAVLFSAGAGITHHLLYTRDLLERASTSRAATRRIYLIWSVRSTDHLAWVSQWMDQILRMPCRRDILVVKLFVSKPRRPADIISPSATVQMLSGRCRPDVVLDEILPKRVGATVVSVCGPGAFADEVRAATRDRIGKGAVVDFTEEAFTW